MEEAPVVTVPAWYLGEVQNRHFGTVWRCRPEPSPNPLQRNAPFVITPISEDQLVRLEEHGELYEDEDYRPGCNPVDEILALFLRGPDNHLRGQLDQYTR